MPYNKIMKKDNGEKLHKVLAACGMGSRRSAEQLILQQRVSVNHKTAVVGMRVSSRDKILIDGKEVKISRAPSQLLCYHKPVGKIVERRATNSVFTDLPPCNEGRWINIGRLDVNSEGLLLFSTDGDMVEKIAHPRYEIEREYLARVDGLLTEVQIRNIQAGLSVDGKIMRPIKFDLYRPAGEGRNHWYRIILTEGRNRAIRRLFANFNLQVARLIRIRMGEYQLPRDLRAGQWALLTQDKQDNKTLSKPRAPSFGPASSRRRDVSKSRRLTH